MSVQSILCILSVILLAGAAIGIYGKGKAAKAQDPTAYIYTRESAMSAIAPGVFMLIAGLGFSIAGGVMGIRDENDDKPAGAEVCGDGMKRTSGDFSDKKPEDTAAGKGRVNKIRLAVLIVSVICIIAGIANGNMKDILIKAINICTECIGLG
ncbi:MAG: hypothetical protein K6E88_00960 [Lachnospiraceae bacterium]|nr:hypothetical protein [Lachnospiraceae bacterium]